MADQAAEEITGINIEPTENGCAVRVSTKCKSKDKNSYDGYAHNTRTYNGESALFNMIMEHIGKEIADETAEEESEGDGGAPLTKFNPKNFKK